MTDSLLEAWDALGAYKETWHPYDILEAIVTHTVTILQVLELLSRILTEKRQSF